MLLVPLASLLLVASSLPEVLSTARKSQKGKGKIAEIPTEVKEGSTPEQVLDLLHDSDTLVESKHLDVFKNFEAILGMAIFKGNPVYQKESGEMNNPLCYKYVLDMFLPRVGDLRMLRFFMKEFPSYQIPGLSDIETSFGTDLYKLPGGHEIFHLPEKGENKLFDVIDPMNIGRFIWTETGFYMHYKGAFRFSILADYVIPAWRKEHVLSESERSIIKELLVDASSSFRDYFSQLAWALYFVTGKKLKTEKTTIKPICTFLEDLGFEWDKITDKSMTLPKYKSQTDEIIEDIDSIYAVAYHWNLDLFKLAKATPNAETSQVVETGFIPEKIKKMSAITARDIFALCNPYRLDVVEMVNIVEGKFVEVEGAPRGVKRRADDNDDGSDEGNKRRRLAAHPLYISDVNHPALTAGRAPKGLPRLFGISPEAAAVLREAVLNEQHLAQTMIQLYQNHLAKDEPEPTVTPATPQQIKELGAQLLNQMKTALNVVPQQYYMMPFFGMAPNMHFPTSYMMQPGIMGPTNPLIPDGITMDMLVQSLDPFGILGFTGNPAASQQEYLQMAVEAARHWASALQQPMVYHPQAQ